MAGERPGPSERDQRVNSGYARFLEQSRTLLEAPENRLVNNWVKEQISGMPEMKLSTVPLTGAGGWTHESTPSGEVKKISSGFFTVEGSFVDKGTKKANGSPEGWVQGGIHQSEIPVTIPTPGGDITMDASGFVGVIRDRDGRVLLSMGQEPYARTSKNALARTPYQTSAKKLQGLLDGKRELDPGLSDALEIIGRGRSLAEMFRSGDFQPFPLALADGNRIDATNIGFSHTVRGSDVHAKLTADGKNRWCKPDEVKALTQAGLLNGHTAAAILAVA